MSKLVGMIMGRNFAIDAGVFVVELGKYRRPKVDQKERASAVRSGTRSISRSSTSERKKVYLKYYQNL